MDTNNPRITLFQDNEYGGSSKTFTTEARNLIPYGFNDRCSSIKVGSGVWLLYEGTDYSGNMWVVWEGQVYDVSYKWTDQNDVLSSLKPIKVKTSEDSKCELFDRNKSGAKITLTQAETDLRAFQFNDRCSFVNVISGTWVGYWHGNCTGPQILLEEGEHDLSRERGGIFNNGISSMKPIEINYPIKVLSMDYDAAAAISQETPRTLYTSSQENNSSTEQTVTFTQGKTVTATDYTEFRWSQTHSVKFSAGISIKIPFFLRAGMSISYSYTNNQEHIVGRRNTTEKSWSIQIPTRIPPHKRMVVTSSVTEAKVSIPFTAHLQKGSKCWTERGTWIGVQNINFSTKFKEFPI